jgi:hypothetical protein
MNKMAGAGMWKRRDDGSPSGAPTSLGKGFAFSTFPHSHFGLRTTSNQKVRKMLDTTQGVRRTAREKLNLVYGMR